LIDKDIKTSISFARIQPQNQEVIKKLAAAHGSLSWYQLFNKKFADAEQAARKGLATDATQEWIHSNLALALLLQDKWDEARAVYEKYKDKAYNDTQSWSSVFRNDIAELEAAGITHPDFKKVRTLLGEKK
jgi:predicted Zn-dependent protease